MRERIRRLHRLRGPADVLLFARVAGVATLVPLLYRLRLSAVQRLLHALPAGGRASEAAAQRIVDMVRLAQAVGRPLVRPGCLVRATTLYYFLRRAGCKVHLCFGTGLPLGEFAGHCWLERDDEPFLERRDPRVHYTEIFRIPGCPAADAPAVAAAARLAGLSAAE
jgi:hypothetical protein